MRTASIIAFAVVIFASFPLPASADGTTAISLPGTTEGVQWPPRVGQPYPDLTLMDQRGELIRLSDFKGKVLLIEPIGMNCPASNALAGGKTKGGFEGTAPETDVEPADISFRYDAPGVSYDDPRLIHIELLLYNMSMHGPSATDARAWAEHFGLADKPNVYVLAGGQELINQMSYDMIPGFQLVDKNFILRSNATGHHPTENWDQLMNKIPALLAQ